MKFRVGSPFLGKHRASPNFRALLLLTAGNQRGWIIGTGHLIDIDCIGKPEVYISRIVAPLFGRGYRLEARKRLRRTGKKTMIKHKTKKEHL